MLIEKVKALKIFSKTKTNISSNYFESMIVDDRPSRFRYDREIEEEDDDDDDDFHFVMLSQRKSSSENSDKDEHDENLKSSDDHSFESKQQRKMREQNEQTRDDEHVNEITTSTTGSKLDLYEFNNLHRTNYEAYRNECSRLMANESYEPALAPVVAVDLRRLLRDKAMSHHCTRQNQTAASFEQQQNNYETTTNEYDMSGTAGNHFEYEPNRKPIEAGREIDLQRPYRRFYLSKRPPFYSSCHNRGGGCGTASSRSTQYSRRSKPNGSYCHDPNDDNLINNHNNNTEDDHNDKDNNYDDEKSRKKLKSVVVVKVNYTNSSN